MVFNNVIQPQNEIIEYEAMWANDYEKKGAIRVSNIKEILDVLNGIFS